MLIAGAGGHAKEIITELHWLGYNKLLLFFDDTPQAADRVYGLPVLRDEAAVRDAVAADPYFIIATGKPAVRQLIYNKMTGWGAKPFSLLSAHALIGNYEIKLGEGINIMSGALITASVTIGKGTLVNAKASVHHDCTIGEFCELSPGCSVLGKVSIGNYVSVGTGAILLPGIRVGNNAVIGAGAVVTKDVPAGVLVKGMPARW